MPPLSDDPPADPRAAVVIYRSPLFNRSETFVRSHVRSLVRYRPLLTGIEDKGNIPPDFARDLFLPRSAAARSLARMGYWGATADLLRDEHAALVHAHFATDALTALPLARALGVPLIATLHGYDVTRTRAHLLASGRLSWMKYAVRRRAVMQGCRLFLAVSDALRQAALAQGFPAERVLTHYLGIDTARFRPGGAREPGLVLHVGRLVEKKGTAVLIDAIARLADAHLVVIGDGPERSRLQRQAAGLNGRVRFLGNLGEEDVGRWMTRAAMLAAPSVTARDGDAEGLPTVILEAAASGVPVVATHHSGIPEAVRDGETGFLVPEHDAGALAARIGLLLESGDLRERMGLAARRMVETGFDLTRQSARLEDIYDRLRGAASGGG